MNTKKNPDQQLDLFESDEPFSEIPQSGVQSSDRFRRYSDVREIDPGSKEWYSCESAEPFCSIDEVSADVFEKIYHQMTLSEDPVFQMKSPADLQSLIMMLWQVRGQHAERALSNSPRDRRKQDTRIFYRVYRSFHRSYRDLRVRRSLDQEKIRKSSNKYRYLLKKFASWLLSREFDLYNRETGLIEHHWRVTDCNILELRKIYPKLTMVRTENGEEQKKTVDLIDIFLQLSF